MTSRTKRRLAVLVLALALIAAAPYVYYAVTDREPYFVTTDLPVWGVAVGVQQYESGRMRTVEFAVGPSLLQFSTDPRCCVFAWQSDLPGRLNAGRVFLPPDYITLRVACAVALAGVWGLVAGGRLLAQRSRRAKFQPQGSTMSDER